MYGQNSKLLAALNANWHAEMQGFYTYKGLAERERNSQRCNALRSLAAAEKHHADLWAERIRAVGGPEPT
jgi:rubrerythrin